MTEWTDFYDGALHPDDPDPAMHDYIHPVAWRERRWGHHWVDPASSAVAPRAVTCSHDCAIGIGTVSTHVPPWSGVIWECTECHAIGEDSPDAPVVWAEGDTDAQD